MKPSFAIVGCGKVGFALGTWLGACGYRPAGFCGRSVESAKEAAGRAGCDIFTDRPPDVTKEADIVFITTPDGVIGEVCARIADQDGFKKGASVLHCSGALPSTVMEPAVQSRGAFSGSLHPLQSFASREFKKNPFSGIIAAIEGTGPAAETARAAAKALGARPIDIRTDCKVLYHASAVVASNYLVALLDFAFALMEKAGVPRKDAPDVLKPLINGTLANIKKSGVKKALTGPIARGDAATVERHLKEIEGKTPQLLDLYKTLGRHAIELAKTGNALSESAEKKLKALTRD
jgi:predicted short-subunit dehydrogenase-like oxidoreductase (DUF2520 family)